MFNTDFWDKRAEKYGHTGHAEPVYYCFDQEARLFAINKILASLTVEKHSALDFGCGSGDFLKLLSQHFKRVQGFDVSEKVVALAKKRFIGSNVHISNQTEDLSPKNKFDLILTVTVLQTLSSDDLEKTLAQLAALLSEDGKMICMEFFATEEYNLKSKEERVTHANWLALLQKNDLKLIEEKGFYNPILFPTLSWKNYRKNVIANCLRPLKQFVFAQTFLGGLAKKLIESHQDVFPYPGSTFKVYTLEKRKQAKGAVSSPILNN